MSARSSTRRLVRETRQATADQLSRFGDRALDEFFAARYVVDQSCNHAARPCAGFHLAALHDRGIDARDLGQDVFELDVAAERALLLEQAIDGVVPQHALRVA